MSPDESKAPDFISNHFEDGLNAFIDCQYGIAYESFRKALDEYEKTEQSRDVPEYYGLRYFKDFSKGLELLGTKGGFTRSARFFTSAVIWTKKLPPELASELAPSAEFFSKIIPLDERLRGLFAHPVDFNHLAEGINIILEPLSDLSMDSYIVETIPQVKVLVNARANICIVLLYLLGKTPQETLSALLRDKNPADLENDTGKLILWILNQEERDLMETGCDKLYELLPAVSLFAREMVRLGAPEQLYEIPEITRARLLSLLSPLRELDISAGTILEPVLKRFFKENPFNLIASSSGEKQEKKPYQTTVQFPVPAGHQWLDLFMVIFMKTREIEATIGDIRKRFSFRELGLVNTKTDKLNILGETLILFGEHAGLLSWHTSGADKKLKLRINRLTNLLKSIFPGLTGSPFYPYQQYKAYKIRFNLELSYEEDDDTEDSLHTPESPLLRGDFDKDSDTSIIRDDSDDDDPENL
jgi:hypothetical protein